METPEVKENLEKNQGETPKAKEFDAKGVNARIQEIRDAELKEENKMKEAGEIYEGSEIGETFQETSEIGETYQDN